jgi:hypothetical protein
MRCCWGRTRSLRPTSFASYTLVIPRACGVSSAPRPLDLISTFLEYWIARSSRAMTAAWGGADSIFKQPRHASVSSRREAPESYTNRPPRKTEGAGKAGCADRTRSLACKIKKHTSIVTTGSPELPGLPCAMVLTAYIVLSPATGLFCHRRRRNCFRQLDASVGASGPHDFAVRKPALSSAAPSASIASRLNVRDDREAPLLIEAGQRGKKSLIWGTRQASDSDSSADERIQIAS